MRLLFLNEKLDYASTSSYSLDLARALRRRGDEVQLASTGGSLREVFRASGIETYLAKFNFFSYRKLLQLLREFSPELIHVQNLRSAGFGQQISSRLGVPHVVTVHRTPGESAPPLMHPLLAGVIAVNEVIRETLVNDRNIAKSLVRVIRHGVDVDLLRPEPRESKPARPLIPVIGSVGRLSRIKGHGVFLEAARKVLDRGIEAMFMIVGDGAQESELRRRARELRLEHHVTFSAHIPGRRELYRIFDIVAVPTLRGGVGLTVLEAMAMGKPVIASAVGEVLHVVQDRKTGLLVPEGDSGALAEGMVELLEHPALARSLGAESRRYVVDQFALAPMVKATREFYDDVQLALLER